MPKITFKFAEGQLVKLQEDRPEEAHVLTDVPTEFLREYCQWADPLNGFIRADGTQGRWQELDHQQLLGATLNWYEENLCIELNTYCDAQELPHLSADEILLARRLTDAQRTYLYDYIDRWGSMVDLFYVVQRG